MKHPLKWLSAGLLVVALSPAVAENPNADRSVLFVNESSQTVLRVYTTRVSDEGHVAILLGGGALLPGQTFFTPIEPDRNVCVFDVRAEFEDGRTSSDRINVCQEDRYFIRDAVSAPSGPSG